jgi:uncharacterized membrane-anchored protein
MEPNLIMQTAAVLLTLAAIGGATMAIIRFSGQPHPPTWLAMLHGFLAAAAVTLLLYACVTVGLPTLANAALALFVIAALGGVVLNLNYHWKQLPLPKPLVLGHGALAVVGFLLLLGAIFR